MPGFLRTMKIEKEGEKKKRTQYTFVYLDAYTVANRTDWPGCGWGFIFINAICNKNSFMYSHLMMELRVQDKMADLSLSASRVSTIKV